MAISTSLRGFENQVEADKVEAPALGLLRLLGGYLNLERLEAEVMYEYFRTAVVTLGHATMIRFGSPLGGNVASSKNA
jgi:hypothetical protein